MPTYAQPSEKLGAKSRALTASHPRSGIAVIRYHLSTTSRHRAVCVPRFAASARSGVFEPLCSMLVGSL